MSKLFLICLVVSYLGTDLAEQKALLEKQLTTADQPGDVHLLLSQVLQQMGEFKAAATHAKKALTFLPDASRAHYGYAVALRKKMEKSPVSWLKGKKTYLSHLEQAIALDKTFAPAYEELAGFNLSAPAFLGAAAKKALEIGETLAQYDAERGSQIIVRAYDKLTDRDKADTTLNRLLTAYPSDPALHLRKAIFLQGEEKFRESLDHLDQFTQEESAYRSSVYQAARSRIVGGFEREKAISLMDFYITLVKPGESVFPTVASARWRQGIAYRDMGDTERAAQLFREALSLDPNHKEAKEALDLLN